jgi:hypothetical protein
MHNLQEFCGKVLILNFWSADCPWSERVDTALLAFLPQWGDKVQLAAVASNKNEAASLLARAARTRQIPLVLHDPDQKLADLYGAFTTPHFFVVDQEGILRYQGAYDDVNFRQRSPTKTYLPGVVNALLARRAPALAHTPTFGCTIVRVEDEG